MLALQLGRLTSLDEQNLAAEGAELAAELTYLDSVMQGGVGEARALCFVTANMTLMGNQWGLFSFRANLLGNSRPVRFDSCLLPWRSKGRRIISRCDCLWTHNEEFCLYIFVQSNAAPRLCVYWVGTRGRKRCSATRA